MIVFGLILVGLAVLLAAGVAASSGNRATLDVFGVGLDTRTSVVFFIGVAAAAALLLGLWLSKAGLARGYRRRKEVRELRHQVQAAPAPMADSSSTRDDRDEDDEHDDTAEVAAGNDAAGSGAESGTGRTTDGDEEAAPAGRHQAPQTEGAESTPGGKSENTEAAERKDDGGLRTVPRSGAD